MKILVTGSTGFVGSHLCRKLAASGHQVRALHRAASQMRGLEGVAVEHALGDLTQPESLTSALEGIDVVFHTAAWTGGGTSRAEQNERLRSVTVEGTRNLLQAARQCGVQRVIHTSSAAALGIPLSGSPEFPEWMNENHTWNCPPELLAYGYAKYQAELEVQKAVAAGLNVVIVNPTLIFGAGDLYRPSTSLITQMAERPLSNVVRGGVNCVHIADVIEGHLAAWHYGAAGERYLLGGENLTFMQLCSLIASVVHRPEPTLVVPTRLVRAMAKPLGILQPFFNLPVSPDLLPLAGRAFFYDTSKARRVLHLETPRPVKDAISEAYAWFQSN